MDCWWGWTESRVTASGSRSSCIGASLVGAGSIEDGDDVDGFSRTFDRLPSVHARSIIWRRRRRPISCIRRPRRRLHVRWSTQSMLLRRPSPILARIRLSNLVIHLRTHSKPILQPSSPQYCRRVLCASASKSSTSFRKYSTSFPDDGGPRIRCCFAGG